MPARSRGMPRNSTRMFQCHCRAVGHLPHANTATTTHTSVRRHRPLLSGHRRARLVSGGELWFLIAVAPMDIRQLQYLAALAREKHFTRAAKACSVTQPTLSGRIRQLEQELGVPIVERGQRFHGLTPEGERVLNWANAILDNWSSLQQDIACLRNASGALTGHLAIG